MSVWVMVYDSAMAGIPAVSFSACWDILSSCSLDPRSELPHSDRGSLPAWHDSLPSRQPLSWPVCLLWCHLPLTNSTWTGWTVGQHQDTDELHPLLQPLYTVKLQLSSCRFQSLNDDVLWDMCNHSSCSHLHLCPEPMFSRPTLFPCTNPDRRPAFSTRLEPFEVVNIINPSAVPSRSLLLRQSQPSGRTPSTHPTDQEPASLYGWWDPALGYSAFLSRNCIV